MSLNASAPTKRAAHFERRVQAASIKQSMGLVIDPATVADGRPL